MKKYKKYGFQAFKSGRYDLAKTYFSLAKEHFSDDEIFFLVSLCQTAKNDSKKAHFIFDLYLSKKDKSVNYIKLNSLLSEMEIDEIKISSDEIINSESAIDYTEFKNLISKDRREFREFLEDLMFSSKLIIKNKDDFLDFISLLVDNDMNELGLHYLELMLSMYSWDERVGRILNKINSNEDRNFK